MLLIGIGTTVPLSESDQSIIDALAAAGYDTSWQVPGASITDADVQAASGIVITRSCSVSNLPNLPSLAKGAITKPLLTLNRTIAWVSHLGIASTGSQRASSNLAVQAAGAPVLGQPEGLLPISSADIVQQFVSGTIAAGMERLALSPGGASNEVSIGLVRAGGDLISATAPAAIGLMTWYSSSDVALITAVNDDLLAEMALETLGSPVSPEPSVEVYDVVLTTEVEPAPGAPRVELYDVVLTVPTVELPPVGSGNFAVFYFDEVGLPRYARVAYNSGAGEVFIDTPPTSSPPPELGDITVANFTLLPPHHEYQQATFDTLPADVVFTRRMEYRVKGTTTWSTPVERQRAGDHLLTIGGANDGGKLAPETVYQARVTLFASGFDTETFIIEFTTAAAPASSSLVMDYSMYPSGTDSWERIWWLPAGSSYPTPAGERVFKGARVLRLTPTDKVRIACPEVFVDPGNLEIVEGSWRLQGLVVKFTKWNGALLADGQPAALGRDYNPTEPSVVNNWFLKVVGNLTAYDGAFRALEGCGVAPADDGWVYCWEGRYYDGKLDTSDVLVDNGLRIADATGEQGISWVAFDKNGVVGGGHSGGDVMQEINGPARYYRRNVVAVTSYQGDFMQMDAYGESGHVLQDTKRVAIKGDRGTASRVGGHTHLWWDTSRAKTGVTRVFGTGPDGVYLDAVEGKTRDQVIREASLYSHDDPIVVGPAPRDFFPLAELTPYDPLASRWVAGR